MLSELPRFPAAAQDWQAPDISVYCYISAGLFASITMFDGDSELAIPHQRRIPSESGFVEIGDSIEALEHGTRMHHGKFRYWGVWSSCHRIDVLRDSARYQA
jgi:hypothetical protein